MSLRFKSCSSHSEIAKTISRTIWQPVGELGHVFRAVKVAIKSGNLIFPRQLRLLFIALFFSPLFVDFGFKSFVISACVENSGTIICNLALKNTATSRNSALL